MLLLFKLLIEVYDFGDSPDHIKEPITQTYR